MIRVWHGSAFHAFDKASEGSACGTAGLRGALGLRVGASPPWAGRWPWVRSGMGSQAGAEGALWWLCRASAWAARAFSEGSKPESRNTQNGRLLPPLIS